MPLDSIPLFTKISAMEKLRNKPLYLLAVPVILLLIAGWVRPVLASSCPPHEACGAMPCCAGKQVPGIEAHAAQAVCNAPPASGFEAHARAAHSQKDADCSAPLCFESQAPVITALFEVMPVSGSILLQPAPDSRRAVSPLDCRLFRPPIPAIL